jgi:DNA-binding Lrp family transcriptional regulator
VVELNDQQRKIVTWLSRHRRSTFESIQEAVDIPAEELQGLLAELEEEKRIRSVARKGEVLYSASIHGQAGRRLRGFPEELWKKAGLDD